MTDRAQIEEMARILCGQVKSCNECTVHKPCLMMNCATILTDKGYRKASDVANEFADRFYEIMSNYFSQCGYCNATGYWSSADVKNAINRIIEEFEERGDTSK